MTDRRWLHGGVLIAAIALVLTVACGSGEPGVRVSAADGDPDGTGTVAAGPEGGGQTQSQLDIENTPEAAIGSIADLVAAHGEPPGYDFARLRIPILGVDAPVGISIVGGDSGAQLGSPEGPGSVFWYDLSAWPGLGGLPGAGGNAVFGGHVDISGYVPYADANYHGPAVFRELYLLAPGDRIFVDYAGETLEYAVTWSESIGTDVPSSRWSEIWSAGGGIDSITLYTCGGDFDWDELSYADRLVVRAERV